MLPGKLKQFAVQNGQAFGEILSRQLDLLEHLAGLQLHSAQTGLAVQTGAFEQRAINEDQALREGFRIVSKAADDFI